jgi:hypothetical protein
MRSKSSFVGSIQIFFFYFYTTSYWVDAKSCRSVGFTFFFTIASAVLSYYFSITDATVCKIL